MLKKLNFDKKPLLLSLSAMSTALAHPAEENKINNQIKVREEIDTTINNRIQ